ncbi:MAG: PDZ domain-containing protein [Thermoplasmata archaeon]
MHSVGIRYGVAVEDPKSHIAQFTIDISGIASDSVDLVLPSWIPGSYHIVDPARQVLELTAATDPGGESLQVERRDKARWRIPLVGNPQVHVRYSVYGRRPETDALDVTDEHLFLNAGRFLPYVDGRKEEPVEVAIHVPDDWKIITELREVGKQPFRCRADNYDDLVDNPIDCGTPVLLETRPLGIPHRIVLCGHGGNYEPHRLEEDIGKMVEATIKLFGDSPISHYTFFYHLNDVSDGGLEHRFSTSIVLPRSTFKPEASYLRFLSVTAHEYFHLYNVKRIRPTVLGPFDYTRENYTKLLWAMEGTTDYFSDLILRRAGLVSNSKFLDRCAESIRVYQTIPGRRLRSLEEASLLSWIDLYGPDEDTINRSVSYYRKGALVSMCLDLEIRTRTENRSSLEQVFRHLWEEYGKRDRGIGEDDLLPIMNHVTGLDLGTFFARYVAGTDEVDFDHFARMAGLSFAPKPKPPDADEEGEAGYLGVLFEEHDRRPRLTHVLSDGPGRRAGLSPRDEIVAMNGERVSHDGFAKLLRRFPPGASVEVTLFRRGWLMSRTVTMGKSPPEKYSFVPVGEATALQKSVYEAWTGTRWEPSKPPGNEIPH